MENILAPGNTIPTKPPITERASIIVYTYLVATLTFESMLIYMLINPCAVSCKG